MCRRSDLQPSWGEAALVGHEQVAIFLLPDGTVHAVSNADPATGAFVMSRGIVGSRRGRPTIASPLHKDVFDLATGECYTRPGALRLPTWRVDERDGRIAVAPRPVLIAASHGTSDIAGRSAIASLVDAVREARPEITVLDAFVDVQHPDVAEALSRVGHHPAVSIVPLLLSSGYHVHVDLAEAAASDARHVTVSTALGPDPRLAAVLARRLRAAGVVDGDAVVLAAAGSSDAQAVEECHATGRLLEAELGREVTVSFVSAALPRVADAVNAARDAAPGARVAVASYLLAPGYFADVVASVGADIVAPPILRGDEPPPREVVAIVAELYDGMLPVEHAASSRPLQ